MNRCRQRQSSTIKSIDIFVLPWAAKTRTQMKQNQNEMNKKSTQTHTSTTYTSYSHNKFYREFDISFNHIKLSIY